MVSQKKKILYVITKSIWGGAQRYVYDLATNLPNYQFETVVIAGGKGLLTEKLTARGIRVITLPILQESNALSKILLNPINLRAIFALFNIYRKERPDVIHLNSSKIGGLGALAAFAYKIISYKLSIITIFTVHGWSFKEDRPLPAKIIIWFFSWLASLFQDKIILINTADYETAKRFIPERKLALISNGIGPIVFLPRGEARAFFTQKTGKPIASDAPLVGSIAELTHNKGIIHLISAATACVTRADLKSMQVMIIGEGHDRSRIEGYIAVNAFNDHFNLIGLVPNAAHYLKGLDIFVLPSLKEGLPYTIMEAMAAGLPIIASRVGGIPDLIEHQKTGILVKPKNPEELAKVLSDLLRDSRKRKDLAKNAKESLQKRSFNLDKMLQKTIALYT